MGSIQGEVSELIGLGFRLSDFRDSSERCVAPGGSGESISAICCIPMR